MRKLLIILIYPIALTFASIAYSAGATATLEPNPRSGIPGLITPDNSNLKDLKLLQRKTNETKRNQYDRALKNGYFKKYGVHKNIQNKKSKKDQQSLRYFVFDYTFDIGKNNDLGMISKISFNSNSKKPLYIIGVNETTGAQSVFKILSMNLNEGQLTASVSCPARYSETNEFLIKVSDKSKKQLKQLSQVINKKGQVKRNQTFTYVRLLNQPCFFSVKDKNKVSFVWLDQNNVPAALNKQFSGPQYEK